MIDAFAKALRQLTDPRLNWVVGVSVAGAIVVIVAIGYLAAWAFSGLGPSGWEWLNTSVEWLGTAAVVVVTTVLLFPALVTLIAGALLEYVVRAVEARHYPELPAPRDESMREVLWYLIKFTGLIVLLNIVVLPLYLLLPGLNFLIFWTLNGYLLGREYFEMVALRRLDPAATRRLRKANGGRIFVAGLIIAVLMTVPLVNLLMPVIATAFMVHVYQTLLRRPAAA